jgi:hypothetical protein
MTLTMREQSVIERWNKKGLAGLRVSSLELLENTGMSGGGRNDVDESGGGVCRMLVSHTLRCLPAGLWGKGEGYARELCFLAGVEFDYFIYDELMEKEKGERIDEEFGDEVFLV